MAFVAFKNIHCGMSKRSQRYAHSKIEEEGMFSYELCCPSQAYNFGGGKGAISNKMESIKICPFLSFLPFRSYSSSSTYITFIAQGDH
jgi:hypothetical protein